MNDLVALRRGPVRAIALAVLGLLCAAALAYGATSINYSGQTSQQRTISFTLASSSVKHLQYHINDRCPGGKLLFVKTWGFPALPVKNGRFGGTFVAKAPEKDTAIVSGTVAGRTVHGTLSDRTVDNKTHKLCSGKTTFRLTRGRNGPHD
jgi:hypothetical protein